MEIVRGVVSIIFAILIPFTLTILTYILGVYLILDGVLDLYKIATGRGGTQSTRTHSRNPTSLAGDGWRPRQELYCTWDKMLRDVRTLFVSAGKLVTKRQTS
ncbi:MAG TPA: DUF308 domain-containing protein [Ktedonobacteraceae bacterium]